MSLSSPFHVLTSSLVILLAVQSRSDSNFFGCCVSHTNTVIEQMYLNFGTSPLLVSAILTPGGGGVLPILRYTCMCRANARFLAIFVCLKKFF